MYNNSATGGADSRPLSERASPTEEQAAGVGNGLLKIYYSFQIIF